MTDPIRNVLSIAGSDPSGGAGIQADLKAFAANGVYGMAVLAALTAQNTQGVTGVEPVSLPFIAAQIDAIFEDIRVDAVKIGMLGTSEIVETVTAALERHGAARIVLDPVMVAKGGDRLLAADAVAALRDLLLPRAAIVTPNIPEALDLLGESGAVTREDMPGIAARLLALGPDAVLLKGGHLEGAQSPDFFLDAGRSRWLEGERVGTKNTHGTGCTLSSALAAWLARLDDPLEAAIHARNYVAGAIAAADRLSVGSGHGPTHHFHALWREGA